MLGSQIRKTSLVMALVGVAALAADSQALTANGTGSTEVSARTRSESSLRSKITQQARQCSAAGGHFSKGTINTTCHPLGHSIFQCSSNVTVACQH